MKQQIIKVTVLLAYKLCLTIAHKVQLLQFPARKYLPLAWPRAIQSIFSYPHWKTQSTKHTAALPIVALILELIAMAPQTYN
jgi:hypothetical protein